MKVMLKPGETLTIGFYETTKGNGWMIPEDVDVDHELEGELEINFDTPDYPNQIVVLDKTVETKVVFTEDFGNNAKE